VTCASQAVNGERDDLAEIDLVSNPPIVDSVAVSYGKFHAAGRAIVGNEHVVEDHYSE